LQRGWFFPLHDNWWPQIVTFYTTPTLTPTNCGVHEHKLNSTAAPRIIIWLFCYNECQVHRSLQKWWIGFNVLNECLCYFNLRMIQQYSDLYTFYHDYLPHTYLYPSRIWLNFMAISVWFLSALSQFTFSDFQLSGPEHQRRDLSRRYTHLVHQNLYYIVFAWKIKSTAFKFNLEVNKWSQNVRKKNDIVALKRPTRKITVFVILIF
jgi:hypothetical protein